ncbi:hypothetical protein GCM10027093_64420 [Paraburkholderia jirisanensis]
MHRAARAARGAVLLAVSVAPLAAHSTDYASMAVSLVVPQSCMIQSDNGVALLKPVVTCLHGEPYGIAQTPADPTEAPSTMQLATPNGRGAVWTVGF